MDIPFRAIPAPYWLITCSSLAFALGIVEAANSCPRLLGLSTGAIQDWQLAASSVALANSNGANDKDGCHPRWARLYEVKGRSWCAKHKAPGEWILVDLGVSAQVSGILTQGREEIQEWVTAFSVAYSMDAFRWQFIVDPHTGSKKVFKGNSDSYSVKHNVIDPPIEAKFVRVYVVDFHSRPSLRLEFLGCQECNEMISEPPYTKLTASSYPAWDKKPSCQPEAAFLHSNTGWCARKNNDHQWLQFDFGPPRQITGVITRGRGDPKRHQWVLSYTVSYSNDSVIWFYYKDGNHLDPKIFGGNMDRDTERRHHFNQPFYGRYVRIHPHTWHHGIGMRAGLIGCPYHGDCSPGFFRINQATGCVENLAYGRDTWVNDKRHVWKDWKYGHASLAVDGDLDTGLAKCTIMDNYYVEHPVWMVDLGKRKAVQGIVIVTWQGRGQDKANLYRDYMYNLEKIAVYVANKPRLEAYELLSESRCGVVSRANNTLFQPYLHVECNGAENTIGRRIGKSVTMTVNGYTDPSPTPFSSKLNPGLSQVRVLTLNDGEFQESTLYRLQKGWTLQFRLGPSLLGRRVTVYINHPYSAGAIGEWSRDQYWPIPWQHDSRNTGDDTAIHADVPMVASGGFRYYYNCEDRETAGPHGSGYVCVDPILTVGHTNEVLPLDSIQCQTVLTKCLGTFAQWENRLRVAKESGYNMIHFTPVQELGRSQSSYSLKDQLKLNPAFSGGRSVPYTLEDLGVLVQNMKDEWKVLSICDLVLNHTANESPWIRENPECGYNLVNSPHLRPAYVLDRLFYHLALEVEAGRWESKGIPKEIFTEEHVQAVKRVLHEILLPQVRIHEFFMIHVDNAVKEFAALLATKAPPLTTPCVTEALKIIQDPAYKRLSCTVDMELALQLFNVPKPGTDEEVRRTQCVQDFRRACEGLNSAVYGEVVGHMGAAVENVLANIRYERLQWDGPKIRQVSPKFPLVPPYFYKENVASLKEEEEVIYGLEGAYIMAHNGWVMGDDALKNFAEPGSDVYLRRELIAWGDSVKLRFGKSPDDCPYLWEYFRTYAEQMATIFHGIRLDNCHSTPLHVAEHMVDAARRVRPDLYVIAELFTNSDLKDNVFVNHLGISSLVREAMAAHDSHEEGRLVYRYGGEPVGAFLQPSVRPLVPSIAHAIFMDATHDNPSPVEKRSLYDLLPSAALVSMACCATGSNRGYDELVPHHIHVVKESRLYTSWSDSSTADAGSVSLNSGIINGKRALNKLHSELGAAGFTQVFVDQMSPDVVAVTRHSPVTHQSIILVAHTAFCPPEDEHALKPVQLRPLQVQGTVEEVILEAALYHKGTLAGGKRYVRPDKFVPNSLYVNGCQDYVLELKQNFPLFESKMLIKRQSDDPSMVTMDFKDFYPGSIVAIRVSLQSASQAAVVRLRNLVTGLSCRFTSDAEKLMDGTFPRPAATVQGLHQVLSTLSLADLNVALYRCHQEEEADGRPGSFDIPGFGRMVYCGLQGVMSLLSDIRPKNDLGHPLCNNLRQGLWLADYMAARLNANEGTAELGKWLEAAFAHLKDIPRYLVPCYFDAVVTGTYLILLDRTWSLMSKFVWESSSFVKALALGSVQCGGVVGNARLPDLSPHLSPPLPPQRSIKGQLEQACVSLAAGLPHFCEGYMRSWGRDTFIALRGLFLLTGRYQEARHLILAYGGCLRHGLIPNLLDGGRNARFNCRDAVWWWLQCIQDYVTLAPRGHTILEDVVSRLYPDDQSPPLPAGTKDQLLSDVMQEALQRHFQGVRFRERNAGTRIDGDMKDTGFNNEIGIDLETGFVYGGNEHNCGTWMDKMGSSEKAGNKGKPATPRDGSAVELVGLCRSTVAWLARAFAEGFYPHKGVERVNDNGSELFWTFEEWAQKIDTHFEKQFWINDTPLPADQEPKPELINRRGIYKDSVNATQFWADYQLRPNFPIAMVVAPEMFKPERAWIALQQVEQILLGPLGMKTLDPKDWAYDGNYFNSNDGSDAKVARGFNYHQGPEWLWPVGYFLRALLKFAPMVGGGTELKRTALRVKAILSRHFVEVQSSPWRSLPELTNTDGTFCPDSSPAQAWSMASLLEVLYDLDALEPAKH